MNNYIYINSNLILNIIYDIISLSKEINKINTCPICNKKFNYEYIYISTNTNINIFEYQTHLFTVHNMIDSKFYKKICNKFQDNNVGKNNVGKNNVGKNNVGKNNVGKNNVGKNNVKIVQDKSVGLDLDSNLNVCIDWSLLNTNGTNILDGLYEVGSNQIYIEKNKNISESKISRFSEHSGFIYFEKNKISNISVITGSRVDPSDPLIFMPSNCIEALKVNYIYHTHPKTPYIGSRIKSGIIYEFPSISDIIHYVEHHNNGKLLGSIVIAPEGIYIIRKNNFDRNPIHIDYDIMIGDLEEIFMECYNDSYSKYSKINYKELKTNGEIKLSDSFFYEEVSINYEYINTINKVLEKYDLFIDYYARILFDKPKIYTKKWIFDDIYVPLIN
jgi:hypothetical protein